MTRVVLVGADARRVGAALVQALVADGARVLHADPAQVASAAGRASLVAELGSGLDVLVNAPAFGDQDSSAAALDSALALRLLQAGFAGPLALTRAAWPALRAARGSVVNVCSELAATTSTAAAGRTAAEHALLAWSRALAAAAASEGVHVLTAHCRDGCAERGAADVLAALEARRAECWTPRSLRALAVAQAVLPGTLGRRLAARRSGAPGSRQLG